jgi:prepilin-type N-terminal cleavage/methylation domain-containing protein
MKAKKGFTLIELLAVVVVLGVIGAIATPIVFNAISTARSGADKENARGYLKAVEFSCSQIVVNGAAVPTWATAVSSATFKGTAPAVVPGATALTFSSNCQAQSGTATIGGFTLSALNS